MDGELEKSVSHCRLRPETLGKVEKECKLSQRGSGRLQEKKRIGGKGGAAGRRPFYRYAGQPKRCFGKGPTHRDAGGNKLRA